MLNKANRDKLRKLHAEFNDDNALLWYSACSDNMMPALDALDALEQERDALAAQVAQHERGVASWKEEEALWKEREAALVARAAELEALIMRHTDLCPFGGGADGKRVVCAFGHPGCECADWYNEHGWNSEQRGAGDTREG